MNWSKQTRAHFDFKQVNAKENEITSISVKRNKYSCCNAKQCNFLYLYKHLAYNDIKKRTISDEKL